MRKLICAILCILMILLMAACASEPAAQNGNQTDTVLKETLSGANDDQTDIDPDKTLPGLDAWYKLTIAANDYEMFQVNYGDIITEDFYDELVKLYDRTNTDELNVCLLHTLSDGTRVLLTLEFENSHWTQFTIKSIEIID